MKKHVTTKFKEFINESLYEFNSIAIDITPDNYTESLLLRKKYPLFKNIGVATFLTTTFLWRIVDENELNIVLKTKRITGGNYSVPVEKEFGASFSGSRNDVIDWGIKVKSNGRYVGKLYIIGINAEDKEFLNLNMVERLQEQGFEYKVGDLLVNSKLGDVGLGYSVRNVTLDDVRFIYELNEETKELTDITFDLIKFLIRILEN